MSGAPTIFDSSLLALRRERSRRLAVPGADFLLARAADDLVDRLAAGDADGAEQAMLKHLERSRALYTLPRGDDA